MKVNEKGEFIGDGEEVALEILRDIFGEEAEYSTQVKFTSLLEPEWLDTVSERQEKETLDIVISQNNRIIVFRVQDDHHKGFHTQQRDLVQKKTLEWNNCIVVDLWKDECPILFKNMKNEDSFSEIKSVLSLEKNI